MTHATSFLPQTFNSITYHNDLAAQDENINAVRKTLEAGGFTYTEEEVAALKAKIASGNFHFWRYHKTKDTRVETRTMRQERAVPLLLFISSATPSNFSRRFFLKCSVKDYAVAYRTGLSTPLKVAEKLLAAMDESDKLVSCFIGSGPSSF